MTTMILTIMSVLLWNGCEDTSFYQIEGGDSSSDVIDFHLNEGWTLITESVDSLSTGVKFNDKGEGTVTFELKDGTARDSSIIWKPTATVEHEEGLVWNRDKKEIKFQSVNIQHIDSATVDYDKYHFYFDEGSNLVLDAKSKIVMLDAHGIEKELPYFSFDTIRFMNVKEYVEKEKEVINGKEVQNWEAKLQFRIKRSSGKEYNLIVPVIERIGDDGSGTDKNVSSMEVDKSSSFKRTYDRQKDYIKYIDAWNWIINVKYSDGSESKDTYQKSLNAWFDIPARKTVYQDNLDFSLTSSNTQDVTNGRKFNFTCGGQTFTIGSYWETAKYTKGGKSVELPYHYFSNIKFIKYNATLQGEVTENETLYQKYLVTISMSAVNTSGENEAFNVEYIVMKKKNTDPTDPEDPTKDEDAWIKDSNLTDEGKSTATITIVDNKGVQRDTTVSIQYNISWELDKFFEKTLASNAVSFQSISEGTSTTTTRTSGDFTISTIKTTRVASYAGFTHNIYTTNEKATIKVAGKVLTMPSSDLTPSYNTYSQDQASEANGYKIYPTHLKYNCSYNQKTMSKTQDCNIKVKKDEEKPVYDEDAWIKSSDLTKDGLSSAIITIRNNKGAERDTSVSVQYQNSWNVGSKFDVTKSDKSVSFQGISNGSSTSTSRTQGAFNITKTVTSMVANFDGFSHQLTKTVEKATITVAGKVLTMPSSDIEISYDSYTQDNGSEADGVISYPTHIKYASQYNSESTGSKTQEGTIRVKSSKPDPTYDEDAWIKDSYLDDSNVAHATITIKNNKGQQRDSLVNIQYNVSWSLASLFEANVANNQVSHSGISTSNSSTSTRNVDDFTVLTETKTLRSSFSGFSHNMTTVSEKATIKVAGKILQMPAAEWNISYDGYTQDGGQTSGKVTSYPTHLNYVGKITGNNFSQNKTQEVTLKVTSTDPTEPDITIPEELGDLTGEAYKTIVLVNGNAKTRTECLALGCTNGVYALINGQWYTWVGASTDGVFSASMGNTKKWNPAIVTPAHLGKWEEGWAYQTTNGADAIFSVANVNTENVRTPLLGISIVDNQDGTYTIDGVVYGSR